MKEKMKGPIDEGQDLHITISTQPGTRKLQKVSCRLVALLSSSRYQDALASLVPLDDYKSAASCQQACCQLIVKTFYPQV